MTYVVTDACVRCKFTDCVEVCPVGCFYEGEMMLVINPDECIDCAACEPVCPARAIVREDEPGAAFWRDIAETYASQWPNIIEKVHSFADADDFVGQKNKYDRYFNPNPGGGA